MEENYKVFISDSKAEGKALALAFIAQKAAENNSIQRPQLSKKHIIRGLVLPTAVLAAAITLECIFVPFCLWLFILASTLLTVILFLKPMAVFWVTFYQKFAPVQMRKACRFTPSCSEYTLLAIEKYGAFRGVAKGIKRISRCRIPNGGIDYP